MDAEDGTTEQTESSSSLPLAIEAPLQFVKSFIPGYSKDEDDNEATENIGDKLRKKRMKTKRRSSPLNKRDHASGGIVSHRKKNIGANRSMVRYIGSNVPIAPSQRQYFELFDNSRRAFMSSASTFLTTNLDHVRQHVDQVKYRVVPTLADIGQLVWDDLKVFDGEDEEEYESENEEEDYVEETECADDQQEVDQEEERNESTTTEKENSDKPSTSKKEEGGSQDSVKITALEDELAKLRAQIAMIVSSSNASSAAPSQPTPIAIVAPTFSVPPPPPPPPPPSAALSSIPNMKIQKGKANNSSVNDKSNPPSGPDMNDVLKSLSSVKLKSVPNRSPGGTPIKPKNKNSRHDSNDPADIIARALREKFRNSKTCYDSPETDSSPSGFSPSPRKHKKSPKVSTSHVRPVPRPRPKPRPRTQKKIATKEESVNDVTTTTMGQMKLF